MRTCNICYQEKPLTDFYKGAKYRGGYRPACKACVIAAQSEYQRTERGRAVHRRAVLKHRYGISIAQYDEMLAAQGGGCGICGSKTPGNGEKEFFSVDHDHDCCPGVRSCGKCVRGLLCLRCNNSEGWLNTYGAQIAAYLGRVTFVK